MNVLLIGCGYWGKNYLRILSELDCVDGIYCIDSNINPETKESLIKKFPKIKDIYRVHSISTHNTAPCTIIAAPSSIHFHFANGLLGENKHVLVEKPLAITSKEAQTLKSLSNKNKKILMTGNTYLYHPAINHINAMISSGEIGDIHYLSFKRVHLGLVRDDVNVIWDLLPHDISILLYWLGNDIKEIKTTKFSHGDKTDAVSVNIKMNSGIIVNLQASWTDCEKERTISIVGSRAKVVFDDLNLQSPLKITKKEYNNDKQFIKSDSHAEHLSRITCGDTILPKINYLEPLKQQTERFLYRVMGEYCWDSFDQIGVDTVNILERIDNAD